MEYRSNAAGGEAIAAGVEEESWRIGIQSERQKCLQQFLAHSRKWNLSLPSSLAVHANLPRIRRQAASVEGHEFGDPQPAAVEDLKDQAIPQVAGLFRGNRFEEVQSFLAREGLGNTLWDAGAIERGRGILVDDLDAQQKPEEAPDGGPFPGNRAGIQAAELNFSEMSRQGGVAPDHPDSG